MFHHRMMPIARISLATFFTEYSDALRNAAELLGGPNAIRRVVALAHEIAEPEPLTKRLGRELLWLEELLTLEHVHDLDRPEAARFAAIEPYDPVVEELCLLTDEFTDRLAALREEEIQAFHPSLRAA